MASFNSFTLFLEFQNLLPKQSIYFTYIYNDLLIYSRKTYYFSQAYDIIYL